ncbi:GGDEF domain-containing phosphodiesterase [Vibrio salinus]|uniref:GGDEF domain-containing phosphodiesterase n=1 Tax=Vibrio salinus TaxID=2899784 RepID=UPI001E5F6FE8|nr:EAL domain-containing protein [Vibrio salinus]MCE0496071.1 EAL domain-containing protein [Vibrio salinus]
MTHGNIRHLKLINSERNAYSLKSHKFRLLHIFNTCLEGSYHIDYSGNVTLYNNEFYKQLGFTTCNIKLNDWYQRVHLDDISRIQIRVDLSQLEVGQKLTNHYRILTSANEYVWIENRSICLSENGEKFVVGSHRDISDKKKLESYLNNTAFYDSFSGLFNLRKLFADIDSLKTNNTEFNTVYLKVGNIHSTPDELSNGLANDIVNNLKIASSAFSAYSSVLYRVNASDYVILLNQAVSIAPVVKACLEASSEYSELMYAQGHLLANKLSFGIYPQSTENLDSNEIVSLASRTCMYAEESTSTHIEVYHGSTQNRIDRFFYIENDLKTVLRDRKLSVKFHPIICSKTGEVKSFEALARWKSEQFGHIFPDEFIPVAEKKGLIVELGYLVYEKACSFIKQYNDKNQTNVNININVSVLQLLNTRFPDNIRKITSQLGISPSNVVLEMTETFLLDRNKNARNQLKLLKNMGFSLSLDDFGAGFSSINSFFDFSFNQIKIDKTFATKTMSDEDSSKYLEFLIQLCKTKKISVVIEGIEDSIMLNKFTNMQADLLQGYWFTKPLSIVSATFYNP